jgi:AraC-like DNA-binding protein
LALRMVSHPQIEVLRHGSPELAYELHLRGPARGLEDLVAGYQGFAERAPGGVARREVASPRGVLILDLGDGWRVGDGRLGSFAAGPDDGPTIVAHDGRATCLQVDLTPLGVRTLLGAPPGELAGRVVELADLLGARAGLLLERLAHAPDWGARFALLDAELARRADAAPPPRPDVVRAWRRLRATGGELAVETLAAELRCSRRHLARRFAEDVGLSPKRYARVLRFERAVALITDAHGPPLAHVAARCGYSDQAHLTREVRELAGVTPSALRASVLPGGAGLGAMVPSVQDAPATAA